MEQERKNKWGSKDEPHRLYNNLLLHIPHSSTLLPHKADSCIIDFDEEERLLIDYYTDELFIPEHTDENIDSIIFPYCRLYCDVERLINDPLEKEGLGISYHRKNNTVNAERSFSNLKNVFKLYVAHHAKASIKIVDLVENVLLIDCHSFSNLPNLLNSNPPDIDICIGYNDDETCPDKNIIANIAQYFISLGYKIGINEPFSNSKTFSVPVTYHSIMIEVNKRLYMDEQTLEKTEGFVKLRQDIQSLYHILLSNNE